LPKNYIKSRASQWIKELVENARKMEIDGNIKMERRYISLALEISKHYKVKIPDKRYICKKCNAYLIPGKNATVRIRKNRIVIKCLMCGTVKRFKIR